MATLFQYEPLGSGQIRLLHLRPGTDDIHFTLKPANLGEALDYEAISYCWGDPDDTRTVYCDGCPLQVTNSLFTALKRLRLRDQPRTLWADAVCIDQGNTIEKNEQVKLMSRIYAGPKRVLIWLGEDTSGLEGLEDSIQTALELLPPESHDASVLQETSKRIFREASQLRKEERPNFNDHNWTPINNLLCRPWFDRKWIIQEVVATGDDIPKVMICGDIEIAWRDLASVAYRIMSYGLVGSLSGQSVINARSPHMLSFYTDGARPMRMLGNATMIMMIKHYRSTANMMDSICATGGFQCSVKSDHVYALLSLPAKQQPGSSSDMVEPNYDSPVTDLYKEFARRVLTVDRDLKILALAPHNAIPPFSGPLNRLDLPSWVPDLSHQGFVNQLVSYTIRPQLFNAGGSEVSSISITNDGRSLNVRGRIVDAVKGMATCFNDIPIPSDAEIEPKKGLSVKIKRWIRNWLQESRELASGGGDWARLSPQRKQDFARTMMCGMTGMRDAVPEEVISAFETYMTYLIEYFKPDFQLTEEVREEMLTYGSLIEHPLMSMSSGRRFCVTRDDRFGMVRREVREGDLFCVILGAEVPYVVRPADNGSYELVGDCYLHGTMDGETLSDNRYEPVDIVLE